MSPEQIAEFQRLNAEANRCHTEIVRLHAELADARAEIARTAHAEAILEKLLRPDMYANRSVIWADDDFLVVLGSVDREYPLTPDEADYLRALIAEAGQ